MQSSKCKRGRGAVCISILHLALRCFVASDVRPAAVAGSWYPASADRLRPGVDGYIAGATKDAVPAPIAIVAPHAGLKYSGPVAAFAYKAASQAPCSAPAAVGRSQFAG